nr:hypothetical protein JVH1_6716 [Rhodococcus sp. JVH1]
MAGVLRAARRRSRIIGDPELPMTPEPDEKVGSPWRSNSAAMEFSTEAVHRSAYMISGRLAG